MTGGFALLLGFGLGIRHATDADHIVFISTLTERDVKPWPAVRLAAFWGLGHTASFLATGLLVVLVGVKIPGRFELFAEILVALLCFGLGVHHLVKSRHRPQHAPHVHRRVGLVRPILMGLVHGLAGSAGIALLAATTIQSTWLSVLYLSIFGLGTVIGMMALTLLLSWPLSLSRRLKEGTRAWFLRIPAALSVALGVMIGVSSFSKLFSQ